jgi:hypothetical protein
VNSGNINDFITNYQSATAFSASTPPLLRGANAVSYGTIYGRVGAHEAIAHALTGGIGHPFEFDPDIRSQAFTPQTLRAQSNRMWNIDEGTANALRAKCP